MKILIDSHILVWLLYEPERLSYKAAESLRAADSVLISNVSLWELAIKHKHKKFAYSPQDLVAGVKVLNLEELSLKNEHIVMMTKIILPQADPFDTMLLAQSEAEDCSFLTADKLLLSSKYRTIAAHNISSGS